ncbi:MAG: isochorismatase family cysteine hydrolase [Pseudomonadota bacterium]
MNFAVIIVDMLKDSFNGPPDHPITQGFRAIIPRTNFLLDEARKLNGLIIFACDSYFKEDFLFKGKMHPHAVRGTQGADVIDELEVHPEDIVLPKRRFSAFFKTDLDITLRTLGVDTIAVTGLTTEICVLATAIDGLCNDFYSVIISDCSATRSREVHQAIIAAYSRFPTYPTLRVRTAEEFLTEVKEGRILDIK